MAVPLSSLALGQTVKLTDGRSATVRYVGKPHFSAGDWIGLELETATGKNNGEVQGERYFDCESNHGMFVRPTAIKSVLSSGAGANGGPPEAPRRTSRPVSAAISGLRRQSVLDQPAGKRQSVTAASPTVDRRASLSRSPIKSPSKLPGMSTPAAAGSRTSISAKPRPSISSRTAMAPPPAPAGARSARVSLAERAGTVRPPGVATSPTRRTPTGRQSSVTSFAPRAPTTQIGSGGGLAGQRTRWGSRDDGRPLQSPTIDSDVDEARAGSQNVDRQRGSVDADSSQPPAPAISQDAKPSTLTQRTTNTLGGTAADHREVEELKKKMRIIERKRMEDRDKLKTLDRVQTERDKFESIIQKLQTKMQPQHQEVVSLRKKLSEASKQMDSLEPQQAQHEYLIEMATLDREMAEENAEVLKTEVEALKQRLEELQLEYDVLQAENQELGQGPDAEERTSRSWIQMEREKDRLREALLRLRDMTQEREAELKEQVQSLEEDVQEFAGLKERFESTKERLLMSEANVEDLRQQLDTALGAEAMIEELTQKNVDLGDRVEELTVANDELEGLQQVNDEIELDHIEYEKQMQQELDDKDALLSKHNRHLKEQAEINEENEYTIARYKEIVKTLQADLEDIRTSHQILGAEAEDSTTRSRAMMDVNLKLQASARKSQANHIDMELRKLDAQEATELLKIVKPFLPEGYLKSQDSVSALLRIRRVGFKAHLLHESVKERMTGRLSAGGHEEDAFAGYEVLDRLTWVAGMCRRFVSHIGGASVEQFEKFEGALFDLEPVERALTGWIDGLRSDELKEKQCATELQRIIALMTHLGEVHLPSTLETHASSTLMLVNATQAHIGNTTSALIQIQTMVESSTSSSTSNPDSAPSSPALPPLKDHLTPLISQTRTLATILNKTHRSLADLESRSLTPPQQSINAFAAGESDSKNLLTHVLGLGASLAALIADSSSLPAPISPTDISSTILLSLSSLDASGAASSPFSPLTSLLTTLAPHINHLHALATDIPSAIEFYPSTTPPWLTLAATLHEAHLQTLKSEDETIRLKRSLHEHATQIAVREQEKEEMGVKIELLEARMGDATLHAKRVAELESKIKDREARERELLDALEKAGKEMQQLEHERERYKRLAAAAPSSAVPADDEGGVPGAGMGELGPAGRERMVATGRQIAALQAEIESLRSAVRYLRDERARSLAATAASPSSLLALPPLLPVKKKKEQEQLGLRHAEQAAVLRALVKRIEGIEGGKLNGFEAAGADKEGGRKKKWRPRRETMAWKAIGVRDEWEGWREWAHDVVVGGEAVY